MARQVVRVARHVIADLGCAIDATKRAGAELMLSADESTLTCPSASALLPRSRRWDFRPFSIAVTPSTIQVSDVIRDVTTVDSGEGASERL